MATTIQSSPRGLGKGLDANQGFNVKHQIYGSLMDKEDQVKFPRVQNRSRLEQADETAMSKASSNAFGPNRKYSLDNGTLQDIQKSRFIGIGMNTVGSGPK